jgi:hypothetical protein
MEHSNEDGHKERRDHNFKNETSVIYQSIFSHHLTTYQTLDLASNIALVNSPLDSIAALRCAPNLLVFPHPALWLFIIFVWCWGLNPGPYATSTQPWLKFFKLLKYSSTHKGGVRIGKTPKKLASICCP